ncbi:MAG: polyribonucleotide nucleotidyltransferase [Ignavibacteriales bacterium]|nr:polyribonucleotide nucleotidyltransferase [Ignavibacteriales bacterium]
MIHTKEVEISGRTFSIETGRFARQADGAVMARYGDTMVLVAVVSAHEPREGFDFFPLQVEYREKLSAAGKYPGGFIKREGRPSEKEILSARQIDRPCRPLFPEGYRNETQIVCTVQSSDGENDSDVVAAVGASAALMISDIPFDGPIAEVRVGRVNGEYVVNPTFQQLENSDLELVVAGSEDSIMMVEGEGLEVQEADMLEALEAAHAEIKKLVAMQNELRELCGREKRVFEPPVLEEELVNDVRELAETKIVDLVNSTTEKMERQNILKEIKKTTIEALEEKYPEREKDVASALHDIEKEKMRARILEDGVRLDGRGTKDVRPITIDAPVLARTHGSALFTRGETQSLTTLTLGTKNDEQIVDGLLEETSKRFLLHYNFPPFCVGETGRYTGVGRREIGHGNLAERSLKKQLPGEEEFPYTMRLISDILESNGSSSMATVCAGSLALMDGGVPVKAPVAGIAMGLIKDEDRHAVLSDILGDEDHLGDMDFKVAGTEKGVTGFQMDIKIKGVSFELMTEAMEQAKQGRLHILEKMKEALAEPRPSISKYAPHLVTIMVDPEFIGLLIGPGGKTVQGMQRDFGVEIAIEEDGKVTVASPNGDAAEACREHIRLMTASAEVGEEYEGEVERLLEFGAIVEFMPGKTGLLHISEIDHKRVEKVEDYLKVGDKVRVKLLRIENGKYGLSRKALIERPEGMKDERPSGGGGGRGPRRGGGGGGGRRPPRRN